MGDKDEATKATWKRGLKAKKYVLKVVFDTSVLYTGSASEFLSAALKRTIIENREYDELEIEWYIPEVVKNEREYQMTREANGFLFPIGKLERLIGHKLGIDKEILSTRVRETIDRQITELGLKVLPLDPNKVDWKKIVSDAAFRQPPFENGEKEKGFRDAIIAECFLQTVTSSPRTPITCRIILVSGDGPLKASVVPKISSRKNAKTLLSLDELQDYINTLVSKVTAKFVDSVRDVAATFFFSPGSDKGFIDKEKIIDYIRTTHADKLREYPSNADGRENGKWIIWPPSFVKKERQRITWRSTIQVEATALKSSSVDPSTYLGLASSLSVGGYGPTGPSPLFGKPLDIADLTLYQSYQEPETKMGIPITSSLPYYFPEPGIQMPKAKKTIVAKGHSTFHVLWSVIITSRKNLRNAKVDSTNFIETVWE